MRGISRSRSTSWLSIGVAAVVLTGCGPMMYTINALEAGEAVEQARQAGAAQNAPYEYYYAAAHLDHAREEAGEGEYQRASDLMAVATQFGTRARDLARRRGQESGRR